MKISKKSQLLVVLLAASSLAFGAAEEPNSEKGQLKFTISETLARWDSSWEQAMQIGKPTHVAVFQLENVLHWNPWFRTIVKARGKAKRLWPLQRVAFREEGEKGKLTWQPGEFLIRRWKTDRPSIKFNLYATSEQEARQMAELFIGYAKSLADIKVRQAEAELEHFRKKIADIEDKIPKIKEKTKPLEAELAKIKEKTYYRNKDEAQRSILEWNNLLSAAEVDIIGIQAKIDMISKLEKKYYTEERHTAERPFGGLLESLRKWQMAEAIELAGALARKNAALSFRDKALKFLDLAEKLDSLSAQLFVKQGNLSDYQKSIANIEKGLPQHRANVRLVKVVNNEVKIHPLK